MQKKKESIPSCHRKIATNGQRQKSCHKKTENMQHSNHAQISISHHSFYSIVLDQSLISHWSFLIFSLHFTFVIFPCNFSHAMYNQAHCRYLNPKFNYNYSTSCTLHACQSLHAFLCDSIQPPSPAFMPSHLHELTLFFCF